MISQVKDFVSAAPYIFEEVTDFVLNIIKTFDSNNFVKIHEIKSEIAEYISNLGLSIGSDLPKYIFSAGKAIFNGGLNFILGLMIGFYLLFDFDKVTSKIYNLIPKDWHDGYTEDS